MIRTGWLLWLLPVAAVSAALFQISQEVQALHRDLSGLDRDIAAERDAIRVLRAEWAYLNRPEWLTERMAEADLDLQPIRGDQIIASVADIPMPLPESADDPIGALLSGHLGGVAPIVPIAGAPYGFEAMPLPRRRPPAEPPLMFAGFAGQWQDVDDAATAPGTATAPETAALDPDTAPVAVPAAGPTPPPPQVPLPPLRTLPIATQRPPPAAAEPERPVAASGPITAPAPLPLLPRAEAPPDDAGPDGSPLMLRIRR